MTPIIDVDEPFLHRADTSGEDPSVEPTQPPERVDVDHQIGNELWNSIKGNKSAQVTVPDTTYQGKVHSHRGLTAEQSREIENEEYMTEQMIMNDFIRNNIGIEINAVNLMDSKYIKADSTTQNIYEDAAFEIFNLAYTQDAEKNNRIKNMPFQEYVKLWNPSKDYQTEVRHPNASRNSPSWFFYDVFNADMGGFRSAALESYKRKIEDSDSLGQP